MRKLIQEYFASNSACQGNDFDQDSEEDMDCEQAPELDCKETHAPVVTEVELEEPIIRIEGNADIDIDCNGQGLKELEALEHFSCNCTQFSPAEVLAYNLSFKDMERGM